MECQVALLDGAVASHEQVAFVEGEAGQEIRTSAASWHYEITRRLSHLTELLLALRLDTDRLK